MIHICYGLFDGQGLYSKFTGTSMLSIFENTSAPPNSITVHILHDSTLTQSNHDKFVAIAEKYKQKLEFFNVEVFCEDKIRTVIEKLKKYVQSRFSIGAFYRLMIHKNSFNEKISKMIYLDSDTIVNLDIQELWDYPMEEYAIAAVPEFWATRSYMITDKYLIHSGKVTIEDYFCSGVLVLNFDKIDENFFYTGIDWLAENLQCECPDQDLLNIFFTNTYCKLPEKFNSFISVSQALDNNLIYRKIYHYAGDCLGLNMKNAHDKLFFKYFTKTPWFDINMLQNLYEGTLKISAFDINNFAVQISAAVSGKKRTFAVAPEVVDTAKQFFMVKESEEFFELDAENPAQSIIDSLNQSNGEKIFFIMSDNYEQIGNILVANGFIEGEDFINAMLFLSNNQDNLAYFYRLVKLL